LKEIKEFNVGILAFNEKIAEDLQDKLNKTEPFEDIDGYLWKIKGENIFIHEIDITYETKYKVILDRRSHILKHAMGILMFYAYSGVYIINNPLSFYYFKSNKDCAFGMMHRLGINIPKTCILPPYITPLLSPDEFKYHLEINWEKIVSYVGFPCYIKPAAGRGAINVNKALNLQELRDFYSQSGEEIMVVQQAIQSPYEWQLRCLCIGRKIIPMKYIFRTEDRSEYIFAEDFLSPDTGQMVMNICKVINRAFGYEMNTIEFIIDEEGIPWAIDFNNPVPDARPRTLGEIFYRDYLESLYNHILYIAKNKISFSFLPELNVYSEISRMPLTKEEKFKKALEVAGKYYD